MNTSLEKLNAVFRSHVWHQRWEVIPGVFTPGGNDVCEIMNWTGVPKSLMGRRVLDIGSWNGCASFECERRGAAEIIAIGPENPDHTGFRALKAYLGSKVEYRLGSIYDLHPERIGKFDTILCFGVLYHLRHPLFGLDMVRRVAEADAHFETHYYRPTNRLAGLATRDSSEAGEPSGDEALLQFFRKDELNSDASNWFIPNRQAMHDLLLSSGFKPLSITTHPNGRLAANTRIITGPPEWVTMATGEGFYYDIITKPVLGDKNVY